MSGTSNTPYREQLLDPRWQKKRLHILERDGWMCTLCGDTESTLHVHHNSYGIKAWDVPDDELRTTCKHCHCLLEYSKAHSLAILRVVKSIRPTGALMVGESFDEDTTQRFHFFILLDGYEITYCFYVRRGVWKDLVNLINTLDATN